jgi:hypothetical protein
MVDSFPSLRKKTNIKYFKVLIFVNCFFRFRLFTWDVLSLLHITIVNNVFQTTERHLPKVLCEARKSYLIYVFVYLHVQMYTYHVCIYSLYIYVYIYIYIYMYIYICIYMCVCVCLFIIVLYQDLICNAMLYLVTMLLRPL